MVNWRKVLISFIFLATLSVWFAAFSGPDDKLHVIACDVGQGDALLILHKSTQILIDGGPNNSVIDCLSAHVPFYDRDLELVILTHPQADHYTGLLQVFDDYHVKAFLGNELDGSSQSYQVLKNKLDIEGSRFLVAENDKDLELDLIYLDILHPSRQFLAENYNENLNNENVLGEHTTNDDPNEFSVTFVLHYGNFSMLFTGDLSPDVSEMLIEKDLLEKVDVLKVQHHGSRNGLTEAMLQRVKPEMSIISVGKNQWGHPHKEVLEILSTGGTEVYRTDEMGDVEIVSDGENYWIK